MADAETCPKCKFPIRGDGDTCRLCGEPLPESSADRKETGTWPRPDLNRIAQVAAVEAMFDGGAQSPKAPPPPPPPPKASPRPPAEDVAVWISCPPLEPMPLLKNAGDLYVGRTGAQSQFVLPHHAVSRRHAAFRISDGVIRVEDLSSNGSFLNGKRIENSVVRIGDVVTIGPYDLEITAAYPDEEEDGAHTSEFDFASITSGMIQGNALPEVLQGLEFNAKTGTLKILAGQLRGLLVVRSGKPQFANFGDAHDEAAVLAMLDLSYGRYTFFATPEAGPCSMTRSLTALLLDHSRTVDEG